MSRFRSRDGNGYSEHPFKDQGHTSVRKRIAHFLTLIYQMLLRGEGKGEGRLSSTIERVAVNKNGDICTRRRLSRRRCRIQLLCCSPSTPHSNPWRNAGKAIASTGVICPLIQVCFSRATCNDGKGCHGSLPFTPFCDNTLFIHSSSIWVAAAGQNSGIITVPIPTAV